MKQLILLCQIFLIASGCDYRPDKTLSIAHKSPGDGGYHIEINGNPTSYISGTSYVVSIIGGRTHKASPREKFKAFQLGAKGLTGPPGPLREGHFILYSSQPTEYREDCINTVKQRDNEPKTEIQVMWTAPKRNAGCVTFRAMVLTDSETWYAEEGNLTKTICELTEDTTVAPKNEECCACSEARYKMVFEGLWSSKLHPKDFPKNLWLTHFSDVIGATHRPSFTFWGEGQISSDGLRQVAEWGSARGLEAELKAQAINLRSLVKAPGLWHPHVNENTTAHFAADKTRNLLSVVSMFGPTPDWIVGVSGLNLCNRDCTWVDNKVIELFPYDAGTDNGITYMSPNEPTAPREPISRITTMYPEDPRAPFYNPNAKSFPALAKIYLNLIDTVEKSCDNHVESGAEFPEARNINEFTEDTRRPECNVTEFGPWSPCSVSCGKGLRERKREYVLPMKAAMLGCERQLVSREMCVAENPLCPGDSVYNPTGLVSEPGRNDLFAPAIEDTSSICKTTPFGAWTSCSSTCGIGVMQRHRTFVNRWGYGRKKCPHVSLIEKKECVGPPCPPPSPGINMDPRCTVSEWSDFSPCSATCGTGLMYRSRNLLVSGELKNICAGRVELQQQRQCTLQAVCSQEMLSIKETCLMEPEPGPCRGYFPRWYFEPNERTCLTFPYGGCRGNKNNFKTKEECMRICQKVAVSLGTNSSISENRIDLTSEAAIAVPLDINQTQDCLVSNWSNWTPCSVSCGVGMTMKMRTILQAPSSGGKPCPSSLFRTTSCIKPPCFK